MMKLDIDAKDLKEVAGLPLSKLCYMCLYHSQNEVLETLRKLIRCEEFNMKSPLRDLTKNRQSIAFYAAGRTLDLGGAFNILEFLRKNNFALNLTDEFRQNPLYYAARELNVDACEMLIQGNCDINQLDKNSQTCLFYAVNSNTRKDIRKGKKRNDKESRVRTIEFLCDKGVYVDHVDKQGRTASNFTQDEDIINAFYRGGEPPAKRKKLNNNNNNNNKNNINNKSQKKNTNTGCSNRSAGRAQDKKKSNYLYEHLALIRDSRDPGKIVGRKKYYVDYAKVEDTNSLSRLENEFIDDHRKILAQLFSETPNFDVTCSSLGLNKSAASRKIIISDIATNSVKHARTLKVVEHSSGQVVGYLYFKCKPGSRNAKEETQKEKNLEISHLKVSNLHLRRGLAKALFFGVHSHLVNENMEDYAQDMRLSVYDANAPAVALYERLGFKMFNNPWYSPMKDWPDKNPVPEVQWRRYRRYKVLTQEDPETMKKAKGKKRAATST